MPEELERHNYLASIVRARDMDRYLAILLSPQARQYALMALAAFNAELKKIPHATSEPMLTAMRFQWWREALRGGEGEKKKTGNPVADAVIEGLHLHDLPRQLIVDLLDGHEQLHMSSIGDAAKIGSEVEAPLFELSALLLGGQRGDSLTKASRAAARSCAAAKSTAGERAKLIEVALTMRAQCADHLGQLSPDIFPAFLPVSLTEFYRDMSTENPARQLRRVWTLWRASRRGHL